MADSSTPALVTGASGFVGSAVVARALFERMARHKMPFGSAKAVRALGDRPRAAEDGRKDAVAWFRRASMRR